MQNNANFGVFRIFTPMFLLHIEPDTRQDLDLLLDVQNSLVNQFYRDRPDERAVFHIFELNPRMLFSYRHPTLVNQTMSSHQKISGTKTAKQTFEKMLRDSWRYSIYQEGSFDAQTRRSLAQSIMKIDLPVMPDISHLTDLSEIKTISCAYLSDLVEAKSRWSTGQDGKDQEKRHVDILKLANDTKHGAFSLDHQIPMKEWMTFDCTDGDAPNAIFMHDVGISYPLPTRSQDDTHV